MDNSIITFLRAPCYTGFLRTWGDLGHFGVFVSLFDSCLWVRVSPPRCHSTSMYCTSFPKPVCKSHRSKSIQYIDTSASHIRRYALTVCYSWSLLYHADLIMTIAIHKFILHSSMSSCTQRNDAPARSPVSTIGTQTAITLYEVRTHALSITPCGERRIHQTRFRPTLIRTFA